MALTGKQKKFIKKNVKKKTVAEIAVTLGISAKEIEAYLKKQWGKQKYQKFLDTHERSHLRGGINGGIPTKLREGRLDWNLRGELNLKNWLKQNQKILFFLTFLVFAVYLNSLGNDFVSDDIPALVDNKQINDINLVFANPLAFVQPLLYFLTNKLFGLNPLFFHLTNVFSHLSVTFAVYLLVYLLINEATATFAAALFAVHPVLTETVTWISGGYYTRYTFFILIGLTSYILSTKKKRLYAFSIISFLLALFVTEKAVVFPFILLAFEVAKPPVAPPAGREGLAKVAKKLVVPFLIGGAWIVVHASGISQRVETLQTQFYQEPTTHNPLLQIPIAITSYLKLIFWPKDLTLYHSEMSFTTTQYLIHLAVFLVFLGTTAWGYKKNKQVFFWLSFFGISLLPMLTPFGISWIVAERYVYLGSLGIFAVAAMGINYLGKLAKNKEVSFVLTVILVLLLGTRTIIRNRDWQNQDTLWLATAKTSPSSPQNHNNLGDLYGRRGEFEKAIEEFKKAIELKPGYADAYHNLGNTYQQTGKVDEAIASFEKAIEFNSNLWQSYQNLAAIYFEQENYSRAEENIVEAIKVSPENDNLYLNLGVVYLKMENKEKAKQALEIALSIDPTDQTAQQLLSEISP